MPEKTLGQIAWEAAKQWHGHPRLWADIPVSEQQQYEHIANAVYEAVAKVFGASDA